MLQYQGFGIPAVEDSNHLEFIRDKALIPYFEKALELNPNDKNTLTTLKELYFRLRTKNKVYQEKYDKTMEALNSL